MGWKGTMRSMGAAARQWERQKIRELKQLAKEQELAYAQEIVREYDEFLERLVSLHRSCSTRRQWQGIAASQPPAPPERPEARTLAAQNALASYSPGFLDRLLGRADSRRTALAAAVVQARELEEKEFRRQTKSHLEQMSQWEWERDVAVRILNGDVYAYGEAFSKYNPIDGVPVGSGASLGFLDARRGESRLRVMGPEVVPDEVRALLPSGRLQVRKMPQMRGHEIYRDHVCSAVLRMAREIFAFLPIDEILVHAESTLLNPRTGHLEEQPILSALIPRATLDRMNPKQADPCRAFENFIHRMNFRKSKGLAPVEALTWEELLT